MDRLQRYNQHLLRRALSEARLITSLQVTAGRRLSISSITWDEYWGENGLLAGEIAQLKAAWIALIADGNTNALRRNYVRTYFHLLSRCLSFHACGQSVLATLRRIVGFEAIRITGDSGGSAAAIVNTRHPVYLLSKLVKPHAPENPKYLPLVCPCADSNGAVALYWHYRRIPVMRTNGIQLFVYPPAEVSDRPPSHALIGHLFACLTPRNDPWIRERSRSLFDGVFASLLACHESPRLHLLDMACGSAKVTMTLCRKAFSTYRKSFDLTLVDVVRGNRSIANAFYRNPRVFGNVLFRRQSLFDWVDKNSDKPEVYFNVALLLRACDLFSRFSIETMSHREARSLIGQDTTHDSLDARVLHPAELIQHEQVDKIEYGISRFTFKNGRTFRQLSASDYFKAIHIVQGGGLSVAPDLVFLPVRAFDENVLVLPSGRSLIAQLSAMSQHLIIEDADLLPNHLERHFKEFSLNALTITDVTEQARRRGATVFLINRKTVQ